MRYLLLNGPARRDVGATRGQVSAAAAMFSPAAGGWSGWLSSLDVVSK